MLLEPGSNAPDFTLPDAYGKPVSLNDFRGKKVALWFFPKAGTSGCTIEGEGFRDELPEFERRGIQPLGVSADPPAAQCKFAEKHAFHFPLLCDETHAMLKAYGVWGPRKMMGKQYEGISRITYLINEDGTIFKVYPQVKPEGHAQEVLADWG